MICSSSQHTHVSCFGFGFRFNRSWFSWIDKPKTSLHGLMYIRFVLYTCMLHILNKHSLICPFHEFEFWCFNKTYFWILCQKHWYISLYVYWIISIYYMPKCCFISCFCIWMSFGQNGFSFQKFKFLKIRVLVFEKFS